MKITIEDCKIWKTGNSFVITIPERIIRKFKFKKGDLLDVVCQWCRKENDT